MILVNFFSLLKNKLLRIYEKLFLFLISNNPGIILRGKIIIKGIPLIDVTQGAKLIIENNVTLGSINKGYHLNIHSPVKLMANREGAIIHIGENTRIHGTCIHAYKSITIGKNCLIGGNCQIIDCNGHDLSFLNVQNRINTKGSAKQVIIKDDVWIGANSIILPGVTIGRGSVISANSLVNKDIPAMVIARGNPAITLRNQNT